jgi:hypothetical protein
MVVAADSARSESQKPIAFQVGVLRIGWEAWTESKSKSEIPQKAVNASTNAVNRAICGKPKTQQHWEIRNIKNRPMS